MDLKSIQLSGLKAGEVDGLEEGQFLAYASTWTREPDSYGDVVAKGAFADTIKDWFKSGNTLPILYGHDMTDPFSNLGGAVELTEDDHGLLVKAALDLDNPKAKQVYKMVKGRRISQMSFAFDILEDATVELKSGESARELRKVKLYEVSIVPIGANQDTDIIAVKAMEELAAKAGRSISTKNLDALKSARDTLNSVIESAEASDTDEATEASKTAPQGEAQEGKPAKRSLSALDAQVAYINSL